MTNSDVLAARFEPGFSKDLTYWRVFIGSNRWLRQEVAVWDYGGPYHKELLRYSARLSRAEMLRLWEIIERIGFQDFKQNYTHETMVVTDCPTYWIDVRFGNRAKEVEAYDLHRLAEYENNPAMVSFLELWDAIHQHTPHGKVPIEAGLPKPWWRFW